MVAVHFFFLQWPLEVFQQTISMSRVLAALNWMCLEVSIRYGLQDRSGDHVSYRDLMKNCECPNNPIIRKYKTFGGTCTG